MEKPAPQFDRSFLIELGGGMIFKQAERLFETGGVESVNWESPVLTGSVKGENAIYEPKLNLRSTVFAVNSCNCDDGKRRKVCTHAIAAALHYQALIEEAKHAKLGKDSLNPEPRPEPEPIVTKPKLRSIKLSEDGINLRMLVFLPPNFEAAVERDAIVVKVEAAAGREILPLGNVNPTNAYAVSEPQQKSAFIDRVLVWWKAGWFVAVDGGSLATSARFVGGRASCLLGKETQCSD